jgi:hypothetical protein
MRLTLNLIGIAIFSVGGVWILQGLNLVGGSFMTGQPEWIFIGAATAGAGTGILVWANFRYGLPR